jgi:hypothetical protein
MEKIKEVMCDAVERKIDVLKYVKVKVSLQYAMEAHRGITTTTTTTTLIITTSISCRDTEFNPTFFSWG